MSAIDNFLCLSELDRALAARRIVGRIVWVCEDPYRSEDQRALARELLDLVTDSAVGPLPPTRVDPDGEDERLERLERGPHEHDPRPVGGWPR